MPDYVTSVDAPAYDLEGAEFGHRFTIIPDSGVIEVHCGSHSPMAEQWPVGWHPSLDVLIGQARAHNAEQHPETERPATVACHRQDAEVLIAACTAYLPVHPPAEVTSAFARLLRAQEAAGTEAALRQKLGELRKTYAEEAASHGQHADRGDGPDNWRSAGKSAIYYRCGKEIAALLGEARDDS